MNKRELGATNRAKILSLLAATGYASTRQVAKAVWGRSTESTRRMASRTLHWLVDRKLVVARRDGREVNIANQELLFALNKAGAQHVRQQGATLVAAKVHARDYLRHAHAHRTACNSVYVAVRGTVWSELQVRSGECPVSSFRYSVGAVTAEKIPDLVVADGLGFEWIEVEKSWRSDKDLAKVVDCMRAMFSVKTRFTRVHFVVTAPGARSIANRLKGQLTHGLDFASPRQLKELDARILNQHLRVSELDPETLELRAVSLR